MKGISSIILIIMIGLACNTIQRIEAQEKLQQKKDQNMYTLKPLPYAFNALEPFMDARTVEIHYTKHHQGYVDNLNKALTDYPQLQGMPLEKLLVSLDSIPEKIRTAVRNNGGGDFAHTLFWSIMAPKAGGEPSGDLLATINRDFGSFANFKESFSAAARSFFGSGWVWLALNKAGKLVVIATPGHDVPMQQGLEPLLVIDVWEHAYYLKHQNRRPEYIEAWWQLVNWPQVASYYKAAMSAVKK